MKALVCHLDSPSSVFFCPDTKQDLFLEIMANIQDQASESGSVVAEVGEVCLALQDQCYYRAEVIQLLPDKGSVRVFLLDDGHSLEVTVDSLKPLTRYLGEPGLVVQAELAGLRPAAEEWSAEEIEAAKLVLDVGGETQFDVEVVAAVEGVLQVKV